MKIKQPFNYILKESGKIYALVIGINFLVNLLAGIIFIIFFNVPFHLLSVLREAIPSYGTMLLILFIVSWIYYVLNLYLGNQLGRTRATMFFATILAFLTIISLVALFYAIGGISFYRNKDMLDMINPNLPNGKIFIETFIFVLISFINIFSLSLFFSSIWVRTKTITKFIIFIIIPLLLGISIPRLVYNSTGSYQKLIDVIYSVVQFFGYGDEYVNIARMSITNLLFIIIPILAFSYFVSNTIELKSKKN